jgi:hypothetical protein
MKFVHVLECHTWIFTRATFASLFLRGQLKSACACANENLHIAFGKCIYLESMRKVQGHHHTTQNPARSVSLISFLFLQIYFYARTYTHNLHMHMHLNAQTQYDIFVPGLPARLRVPHSQLRIDPDKMDESSQQESSNVSGAMIISMYVPGYSG